MSTPRKIEGSAMITILKSIDARRVPRVVFERAIHLYCVCYLILPLESKKGNSLKFQPTNILWLQNKIKSFTFLYLSSPLSLNFLRLNQILNFLDDSHFKQHLSGDLSLPTFLFLPEVLSWIRVPHDRMKFKVYSFLLISLSRRFQSPKDVYYLFADIEVRDLVQKPILKRVIKKYELS